MTTPVKVLQPSEREVLSRDEDVIKKGLSNFVEVGNALLEIRTFRLYRETHETFEDYLEEKWKIKRRRAYQLMEAAGVAENVQKIAQTEVNEAQARELAKVPKEERQETLRKAMEAAKADGRDITAKDIKQAANHSEVPKSSPDPEPIEAPERPHITQPTIEPEPEPEEQEAELTLPQEAGEIRDDWPQIDVSLRVIEQEYTTLSRLDFD
jgi:histone H3/H4